MDLPLIIDTPFGAVRAWVPRVGPWHGLEAAPSSRVTAEMVLFADAHAARQLHEQVTGTRGAPPSQIASELALAVDAGLIAFQALTPEPADPPSALPVTDLASLAGPDDAVERTTTFIAVVVQEQDGTPRTGRRVVISQGDKEVSSPATNAVGFADADGLRSGMCRVCFIDLDTLDFSPQTALAGTRPSAPVGPVRATVSPDDADTIGEAA